MSPPRVYRFTVASRSYDRIAGGATNWEVHFRVSRRGDIRKVRRMLAKKAFDLFQRFMVRNLGSYVPIERPKIRFEREEPTSKTTKRVVAEGRFLFAKGRRWEASRLGRSRLVYARKRRTKRRQKIAKKSKHGSKNKGA